MLLAELNVERDTTHSPLFQAFLNYRQGLQERQAWGGCELEMLEEIHTGKMAYDVTVDVTESDADTVIIFRAQKSLYDLTATNLLCKTYVYFLDTLIKNLTLPLKNIPRFSDKQRVDGIDIGRGRSLS